MFITDYTTYRDYFKEMSIGETGHVDLKDFYIGSVNDLSEATLSRLKYPCLWLEDPDIKLMGIGHDNDKASFGGGFVVLDLPGRDDPEKMQEVKQKLFVIGIDIVSRMKRDFQDSNLNIDTESFSGNTIDSILVDAAAGWRWEFRVVDPVSICYNPSKFKVVEEP